MDRRRLAALSLLKRLKKHEMELNARELGALRLEAVELVRQKQGLEDGIQQQTQDLDVTLTPYMRRFLPAAKAEIRNLDVNIANLARPITALEENISNKFREFKTFDIMHNSLKERIQQEQEAREVAAAEEVLLARWNRE